MSNQGIIFYADLVKIFLDVYLQANLINQYKQVKSKVNCVMNQ